VRPVVDPRVNLRRATPADVPHAKTIIANALAAYDLPFEPEGRDADVTLFGGRNDHDDFVIEIKGRIVGVASIGPHGDDGVAWVSKVFVANDTRRVGAGRTLLRATHDAARARGYARVGLRTRVVFKEAIALYESEGYALTFGGGDHPQLAAGDVVYFRDL
jgi:GNAT superfamily N-acetyltransferase